MPPTAMGARFRRLREKLRQAYVLGHPLRSPLSVMEDEGLMQRDTAKFTN